MTEVSFWISGSPNRRQVKKPSVLCKIMPLVIQSICPLHLFLYLSLPPRSKRHQDQCQPGAMGSAFEVKGTPRVGRGTPLDYEQLQLPDKLPAVTSLVGKCLTSFPTERIQSSLLQEVLARANCIIPLLYLSPSPSSTH